MGLTPEPVVRAAGRGRVVALTVDDGPAPDTAALLDVLGGLGVRATFCVVGERVATPEGARLLRRTVEAGHALANHGWDYADLGAADPETVGRALQATAAAVADAVGAVPVRWFRAANGSWGRTAEVAVRLGMQPLGVVGAVGDWLTQDEPTLVARLRAAVRPGGLLLVHDGGGDRRGTVAAVGRVAAGLLEEGWTFTLPEHPDDLSGAAAG
jgi:peptidoglycan/xylan/chitin deacetylase (PgdA/CDA1 family)